MKKEKGQDTYIEILINFRLQMARKLENKKKRFLNQEVHSPMNSLKKSLVFERSFMTQEVLARNYTRLPNHAKKGSLKQQEIRSRGTPSVTNAARSQKLHNERRNKPWCNSVILFPQPSNLIKVC